MPLKLPSEPGAMKWTRAPPKKRTKGWIKTTSKIELNISTIPSLFFCPGLLKKSVKKNSRTVKTANVPKITITSGFICYIICGKDTTQ